MSILLREMKSGEVEVIDKTFNMFNNVVGIQKKNLKEDKKNYIKLKFGAEGYYVMDAWKLLVFDEK